MPPRLELAVVGSGGVGVEIVDGGFDGFEQVEDVGFGLSG